MTKPDPEPASEGVLHVVIVDGAGNPSLAPMPGWRCDKDGNMLPNATEETGTASQANPQETDMEAYGAGRDAAAIAADLAADMGTASHATPQEEEHQATGTCWVTATTTPTSDDAGPQNMGNVPPPQPSEPDSTGLPQGLAWGPGRGGYLEPMPADDPRAGTPPWPQEPGNVPPTSAPAPPADDPVSRAKELARSVMNRLKAEKRWFGLVDLVRDQMMKDAKAAIPDLVQRQLWVYGELERIYLTPPPNPPNVTEIPIHIGNSDVSPLIPTNPISESLTDSGQIQGLSDVPKDWPSLPANASMAVELAWVQANRLRVVTERPGKATQVKLDQAISPAPSWAALGWLETSIRSYAKFLDAAVKVGGGDDEGESAVMKRERRSVEDVRALIQEMQAAEGTCPHCRRPY